MSVVLPAHNEVGAIEGVVRGFQNAVVARMPGAELLVAEDGSTDGTKELLATLQKELGFRLVQGSERKGYLRGVRDALQAAKGDWVFFCDTDGTHDPQDFWLLWEKRSDAALIAGKKISRKDPTFRKVASKVYNGLISGMFGFRIRDSNAGFKLLRRDIVETIVPKIRHLKLGFSTELVIRTQAAGLTVLEVPVRHFPRTTGNADQFPITGIPKIAWRMVKGLRALKKELRATKAARAT